MEIVKRASKIGIDRQACAQRKVLSVLIKTEIERRKEIVKSVRRRGGRQIKGDIISQVKASQVLDSRGNPTVEVDVLTKDGTRGRAIVPSGASTGIHEALELRDGDPKVYDGKGVLKAVSNVWKIGRKIVGMSSGGQKEIDQEMIRLDGTKNKQKLGANAILGVSMAIARAAASSRNLPLYEYLAGKRKYKLPVPMMNVINGGMHAGNKLSVQEFLIEPVGGKSFSDALRMGAEVYHALKGTLKEKYGKNAINVGDEGGYAPPLESTREALDCILEAISSAGYTSSQVKLGFDAASSSFFDQNSLSYLIDGRKFSSGELSDYYAELLGSYPIFTIEDPFSQDAFSDFASFTKKYGRRIKIIGDDIFVTNKSRIEKGIEEKAANSVLIKLNQVGSVTETLEAVSLARSAGLEIVISHRSGETEDSFISHLATALESPFIKAGAPARGERTAKYNELLRIERDLGKNALFAGRSF